MDAWAEINRQVLGDLFGRTGPDEVRFRLWDNSCWPDKSERRAQVVLNHPGALRAALGSGSELGAAEAYIHNDVDIEGDIQAVINEAESLVDQATDLKGKLALRRKLRRLPASSHSPANHRKPARLGGRRHSIKRDRQAISYHYDVSNDFYALWLDKNMVYSCAYFTDPKTDLDAAQEAKLDLICRKLRLGPGRRLLDVGCGWGGLLMYAAREYGTDAHGITLSPAQGNMACDRIAARGLGRCCSIEVKDYRQVEPDNQYDAVVSVGMFEHVGEAALESYFRKAWRLLKPGGLFLNHGIARNYRRRPRRGPGFAAAYVFPDGELVPISKTLEAAEKTGFEVRDVESLREHYSLTLSHWVKRLERRHEEAVQVVDEATYRVWRLYMAGAAHGFKTGRMSVYQVLLSKPARGGASGLPLTRAHLIGKSTASA